MDYWRVCDELSVIQAALLVVGTDPAGDQEYVLEQEPHKRPPGFDAAFAAITHAILAQRLSARIRRSAKTLGWTEDNNLEEKITGDQQNDSVNYKANPDWSITTVAVDDLRVWLRGRGIRRGFFFFEEKDSIDYLNPRNSHYSPKLAAAITAWEAVSRDSALTRGKTVKQALVIWLRRNADEYGLTKDDGNPNEQGIEEVSKIANWDAKGGAPKTPGE